MSRYVWIQTRDGSPTLWHNELGEPFRSYKGAFSESWAAFVGPALSHALAHAGLQKREIVVGEFGLGPGTNWLLWTLAARARQIPTRYFAVERDRGSFDMGRAQWRQCGEQLVALLNDRLQLSLSARDIAQSCADMSDPRVYPDLASAREAGERADVWFHDPFGLDVNPDAYALDCLAQCAQLWQATCWGGSYACNRSFRDALEAQGAQVAVLPIGAEGLKRERLEFTRRPQ